jgi:hypothetical protein
MGRTVMKAMRTEKRQTIELEKVRRLYEAGVRVLEVTSWRRNNGERAVHWLAWGIDGLQADWRELGLEGALSELANELAGRYDGTARLHIYLMGYRLRYRNWNEGDWESVEVQGMLGRYHAEPRVYDWGYSLRERLKHLVTRYTDWYYYDAPEEWHKRYGPEPTFEAILDLGRAQEEWSVLEEPLVPGLLREILK